MAEPENETETIAPAVPVAIRSATGPRRAPSLPELHASAKALYLDLCAHHVEAAVEAPAIAEIRDGAEQVALKLGKAIRARVEGARLEADS